ncbi:CDP-diacylglycerol--serine O-phosphatidyltransferase [Paucibacter sp. O1-1]|uniref:CDP-diacylglycerol--serine O-phosphatidyltransferase n=1 Tax=Paucibacter sp. M5-1 TaxID=3015998 RepID=UPI0021D4E933|nr:CDP-diacylglycerol--serine O-phosphatidyltransferase [Paucibacter sp. M5-1]MCU7371525.1 CDP-diacylglycerol--serine O-phosphatidyltransferase [Paucibacter sp. O1-1]MCZ7883379.1 CDP-diacylglycerol--serine O-phosphatidyltransferase [Paucibacter sp. M5-1]MDA3826514.1 CDP-diacylglycerol--serine O-phosphatidyltransferase [Paucibacter sp. O1-1]
MTEPNKKSPTELPDEDEDTVPAPVRPRRKGIYVLPNAITLAALFSGFYAIVMSMNGRFELACIAIFCAAVLDSLDGRVARMTNAQSAFGEQMDSLSDMVSFGAAPALIVYVWAFKDMGKLGWIPSFVYISGAALRLARFNVNIGVVDKRFFQGLPSPAAAAIVIGMIWAFDDYGFKQVTHLPWVVWTAFGMTLFAGLSMVTNAPFYSFKVVGARRTVPFVVLVAIALAIVLISQNPPLGLFAIFCAYGLSGYVIYFWRKAKGKQVSMIATSTDEPDEQGLHR